MDANAPVSRPVPGSAIVCSVHFRRADGGACVERSDVVRSASAGWRGSAHVPRPRPPCHGAQPCGPRDPRHPVEAPDATPRLWKRCQPQPRCRHSANLGRRSEVRSDSSCLPVTNPAVAAWQIQVSLYYLSGVLHPYGHAPQSMISHRLLQCNGSHLLRVAPPQRPPHSPTCRLCLQKEERSWEGRGCAAGGVGHHALVLPPRLPRTSGRSGCACR